MNAWKKVILFRRYFDLIGKSTFLDCLPFQEYGVVANEKASIDQYQWNGSLKMKDNIDRLALHLYLSATAPKTESSLLPTIPLEIEKIEKNTPTLVYTRYRAKVLAVDKREIALKAPLQMVWDAECNEAVWNLLQKEFSSLKNSTAKTEEDRLKALEKIPSDERVKIDFFVRRYLISSHPEWIENSLKFSH